MSTTVHFTSYIKGGLPVEVEARIHPSEPDVGIFEPQVEIEDIRWPGKKGKTVPDKLFQYALLNDSEKLMLDALEEAGNDDRY